MMQNMRPASPDTGHPTPPTILSITNRDGGPGSRAGRSAPHLNGLHRLARHCRHQRQPQHDQPVLSGERGKPEHLARGARLTAMTWSPNATSTAARA